jgi:hypothetical protein
VKELKELRSKNEKYENNIKVLEETISKLDNDFNSCALCKFKETIKKVNSQK